MVCRANSQPSRRRDTSKKFVVLESRIGAIRIEVGNEDDLLLNVADIQIRTSDVPFLSGGYTGVDYVGHRPYLRLILVKALQAKLISKPKGRQRPVQSHLRRGLRLALELAA